MSLRELIRRHHAHRPSAGYLIDRHGQVRVTYRQLDEAVSRWQLRLAGADRVLLDVEDPFRFALAYLGVIAGGRDCAPVDPDAPEPDLARSTRRTRPDLVISDRPLRWRESGLPVLDVADDRAGTRSAVTPPSARNPGAVLMQTSGSTGEPKLIRLNERRLVAVATAVAEHNRLGPGDRGYNPLPLFHINGQVVGLLATLVSGGSLALDRRFQRSGFWSVIATADVTWINAVPAILGILARAELPYRPGGLRFIRSASAPLPAAVRARIRDGVGVAVIESYGMTEAASQITATELDTEPPAGSAGRPVGAELQIRGDDGRLVEAGVVGRVWIRGPGVIAGYSDGGDDGDARFDDGGWLDTGDIGHRDAEGYLFLDGRADDVINRGGELVYPREVEEVLLRDDRVADAVVIGRADETLGCVPVALILPTPSLGQDDRLRLVDDLREMCQAELSRFKRPAAFELVEEFPRASVGKIRRHLVKSAVRAAR